MTLNQDLYLFSGLGADKRIFQKLDLSGYSVNYIEWKAPLNDESIEHYASRLLSQIKTPKPTLIGLSFGGIMAIEVAKLIETEKVILISSIKSGNEVPFYYRWMAHTGMHKHIPSDFFKSTNFITNWLFGTVTPFDQQLLKEILSDTNPDFFKWALNQIIRWKNKTLPKNLVQIHGTGDRILPIRFTDYDIVVKKGGHFMTLNRSDEINRILKLQLE
jgi:pimeloyl-ACP methyl ester carboxylesterase